MTETGLDFTESEIQLSRVRRAALAVANAFRSKLEDVPGVVRAESPESEERQALALVEEVREIHYL